MRYKDEITDGNTHPSLLQSAIANQNLLSSVWKPSLISRTKLFQLTQTFLIPLKLSLFLFYFYLFMMIFRTFSLLGSETFFENFWNFYNITDSWIVFSSSSAPFNFVIDCFVTFSDTLIAALKQNLLDISDGKKSKNY